MLFRSLLGIIAGFMGLLFLLLGLFYLSGFCLEREEKSENNKCKSIYKLNKAIYNMKKSGKVANSKKVNGKQNKRGLLIVGIVIIALIILVLFLRYYNKPLFSPANVNCNSDINQDGRVNSADVAILNSYWQQNCSVANNWCGRTDVNRDGVNDLSDLTIVSANIGIDCAIRVNVQRVVTDLGNGNKQVQLMITSGLKAIAIREGSPDSLQIDKYTLSDNYEVSAFKESENTWIIADRGKAVNDVVLTYTAVSNVDTIDGTYYFVGADGFKSAAVGVESSAMSDFPAEDVGNANITIISPSAGESGSSVPIIILAPGSSSIYYSVVSSDNSYNQDFDYPDTNNLNLSDGSYTIRAFADYPDGTFKKAMLSFVVDSRLDVPAQGFSFEDVNDSLLWKSPEGDVNGMEVTGTNGLRFTRNDAFTISLWFRTTDGNFDNLSSCTFAQFPPGAVSPLFANYFMPYVGEMGTKGAGYILGVRGGCLEFLTTMTGPSATIPYDLNDNDWHQVAVVPGADGGIFLDGAKIKSGVTDYYTYFAENTPAVGKFFSDSSQSKSFEGSIEDVRVFGRALSAEEVSKIYNYRVWNVYNPRGEGVGGPVS